MAKHKKVTEQHEGNPEPIIEEAVVEDAVVEQVTLPPPPTRPLFTTEDTDLYRNLLLERPGTPVLTNMTEAIQFVEDYQRWSRKVQVAFR